MPKMPPYLDSQTLRGRLPSLPRHFFVKRHKDQHSSASSQPTERKMSAQMPPEGVAAVESPHVPKASSSHASVSTSKPSSALPVQLQAPTSPTRPKHLTTRSITEISPPSGSKLHLSSRHHQHRHPHLHSHKHKHGESQSTLQLDPNPEGTTRSEGQTPAGSGNVSRRGSIFGDYTAYAAEMGGPKRLVKEGEVKDEMEKGALRATELRNALLELNGLSNGTTRRLDNTYYSVLEKLSVLQNTISSMKELASMTRRLNAEFEMEAEDVLSDVKEQLDVYENFEDQEKRIQGLSARVNEGRERISVLGGRVQVVKERVEGWEEAEREWKDRTRKRLKMMWILMGIFGGIFVLLWIWQATTAKGSMQEGTKALNASGLLGKIPNMDAIKNETRGMQRQVNRAWEGLNDNEKIEEDPRLRVFDEL